MISEAFLWVHGWRQSSTFWERRIKTRYGILRQWPCQELCMCCLCLTRALIKGVLLPLLHGIANKDSNTPKVSNHMPDWTGIVGIQKSSKALTCLPPRHLVLSHVQICPCLNPACLGTKHPSTRFWILQFISKSLPLHQSPAFSYHKQETLQALQFVRQAGREWRHELTSAEHMGSHWDNRSMLYSRQEINWVTQWSSVHFMKTNLRI